MALFHLLFIKVPKSLSWPSNQERAGESSSGAFPYSIEENREVIVENGEEIVLDVWARGGTGIGTLRATVLSLNMVRSR